jgi:hypothetical protein
MSRPVSMPTGQAVAHNPQPAHVSMPWKSYSARIDASAGETASCSRRRISRHPTILCRGDSVSVCDGHFGSQNPHSMHLSTSGSHAGSGFRCLR